MTNSARPDSVIGGALDRIEATIDAAERCMNASPFWDENSRYAGKALLDYPRSQIAAERSALIPETIANADDLAAAFGPILREAFPGASALQRHAAADALAEAVMIRKSWFATKDQPA